MAILIDATKRVLVQGITGREGLARTRLMRDYGTCVVAGVTPGRGGSTAEGVPVFDTVREAADKAGPIDISVLFVPAPLVREAALEAFEAGVGLLIIVPDRVPLYDALDIAAAAKAHNATFVGPNTLGLLSPERAVLGMMGGQASSLREWAKSGPVGVISRSGGIATSTAYYLSREGIGVSTVVHVGGDAVVGMTEADVLRRFEADDETRLVVMYGEIGTSQEEDAAALIQAGGFTKPLIVHIGGKAAKSGTRFSHAGAIVEGDRGTYDGKTARLREAGATIVDSFADIPRAAADALARLGPPRPRAALPATPAARSPAPATPEQPAPKTSDLHWKTAVTHIQPNEIRLRGFRIDELMGRCTFSQAIYLALTGSLPSAAVGRLIDAMFVAAIDHGATPPSALAARTAASTGAPFNAALAAGILSINQHHGGAIQDSMDMILEALERARAEKCSPDEAAAWLVASYKTSKRRLPGFGHRLHTDDPRTARLMALAEADGLLGEHSAMLRALESALAAGGKRLPINVDGAMAALLLDIGIPKELGNTFFMIARVPGLIAQIHEEKTRERPMRAIHPSDHEYDGPSPREV